MSRAILLVILGVIGVAQATRTELTKHILQDARNDVNASVIGLSHLPVNQALGGSAVYCMVSPHTYIDLGDGGCFKHLNKETLGSFDSKANHEAYAAQLCPFASNSPKHQYQRGLLSFYNSNFIQVPFAMNDVAQACLSGDIQKLSENFINKLEGALGHLDFWTPSDFKEVFCETFLSLPLMLDRISFDAQGLVWETEYHPAVMSFQGHSLQNFYTRRIINVKGCEPIGSSKHARLVLRAVVPTYFRHVYSQSQRGVWKKGAYNMVNRRLGSKFYPSQFENELREVCASALVPGGLDELMSLKSLRGGALLSEGALKRDRGKCNGAQACNYAASTSLHPCKVCSTKTYPCYKNGFCYKPFPGCLYSPSGPPICRNASIESLPASCTCHKAICWYFTDDFMATMQKLKMPDKHAPVCPGL